MQPTAAELRDMLAHRDTRGLRVLIEETHPGNVAEALAQLEPHEIIQALRYPRREDAIEVFEFFSEETQEAVFSGMARREMAQFLEEMSSDDRADLIKRLKPELVDSVLALVAEVDREDIRKLSSYREGTAGAVMTTDYACLEAETTVADALEQLRLQAPDRETIYYIYVVDKNRRLLGFVELKDLIVARPAKQKKVADVMERDVIAVRLNDDPVEVAHKIARYDLIAMPVVDAAHRLVGIVTVDDAMDLIDPEQEDPSASGREGRAASVLGYVDRVAWATGRSRGMWVMAPALVAVCAWMALSGSDSLNDGAATGARLALMALAFGLPFVIALGGGPGARCAVATARDLAREHHPFNSFIHNLADEMRFVLPVPLLVVAAVWGAFLLRSGPAPEGYQHLLAFAAAAGLVQTLLSTILGGVMAIAAGLLNLGLERFVAPAVVGLADIAGLFTYLAIVAPRVLDLT